MSLVYHIANYNAARTTHKEYKSALKNALKEIGFSYMKGRRRYTFYVHYQSLLGRYVEDMTKEQKDNWYYRRIEMVTAEIWCRDYRNKMWKKMRIHAATIILRAWFRAVTNPKYAICRKRLLAEFNNM